MKDSLARKTSITLPEKLEGELRSRAEIEHRTLSGILQEAARFYLNVKKWELLQGEVSLKGRAMGIKNEADVDRLVHGLRR